MDRVHVEGLRRTKNDIIVPEVQKILDAQTFGEVMYYVIVLYHFISRATCSGPTLVLPFCQSLNLSRRVWSIT